MIRANGLAAATGLSAGAVESGGFWEGKARTELQSLPRDRLEGEHDGLMLAHYADAIPP
ncbi:hypothetical protein GCM10022199_09460 [Marihabitans asiaticum]